MQPLASGPVALDSLTLADIRCFENFELRFGEGRAPDDRWTVLLGDNGVGKSTILRSIVLAAIGERTAGSLLDREGPGASMIRWGADHGRVALDTSAGSASFVIGEYQKLDFAQAALEFPVFAYGTGRGSALGGSERSSRMGAADAVGTLFSTDYQLVHAETWLRSLELGALQSKGGDAEQFRDAVHQTLAELLPGVEHLEVTQDEVVLVGEGVGRAGLGALSDGYGSTAGWIMDLIARWSDIVRNRGEPLDGAFTSHISGLLAIDELDLHLHPKWQMRVIDDLRGVFPNLTVVATTHNPLTLHGCRDGEIHVIHRDDEGIEAEQINLVAGLGVDQILTGRWFGLSSTLDPETNQLLADYQVALLETDTDSDDSRRLAREIRSRIGTFAETREERLALQLVAEATKDIPTEDLSDEQTQVLHAQMRSVLGEPVAES